MASMIDDKVTCMSKISFENVIMIKSFSNMTKEWFCKWCGQNDVSLYKQDGYKITLQWFKNDY